MTGSTRTELAFKPDLLSITNSLAIISGKWRLYIILTLGEETLRYSQLSDRMPEISQKILASELKALVALGILSREAYAEIPPRVEYRLTERGRLTLPILRQIQEIGQTLN
ncbi:helix-turn-helix domain-containing protein [Spirosoma sp.]|uniref:winged helix-turn-helix transcriptional regulator n=1 Tax=Spirosoma sp. TaxID=1899569 RepID=UPI0026305E05|nr:helix-turn-helix domain-containing protein [Spirosoma sp.]MCX6214251.1 helix-turn-helix domain-containing protein [Spirosoma sp.]